VEERLGVKMTTSPAIVRNGPDWYPRQTLAQELCLVAATEAIHRLGLDLADALAREAEPAAGLRQLATRPTSTSIGARPTTAKEVAA
jgi:hypothetical protein